MSVARPLKLIFSVIMCGAFLLYLAPNAHACTNPAGGAGDIIYDDDRNLMLYCDANNWISIRGSGQQTPAPSNGLVAHWKLEETSGGTIIDQIGNNNGLWQDNTDDAITSESVIGIDGNALDFEVSDQSHIEINTGAGSTDLDNLGPMTVCAWVNLESMPGANGPIVAKRGGASFGNGGWILGFNNAGGQRYFFNTNLRDGFSTNFNTVDLGTNQHICGTWDGTDGSAGVNIYINAIADNFSAFTDTPVIDDAAMDIEICNDRSSSNFCDGIVDDVRIYNRVLSATEIGDVYQATGGIDLSLVGHWKLDETSGTTVADSSTYGNNGTNTNASPAWAPSGGKVNGALEFSANTDTIDAGNWEIGGTGGITLAAWVYKRSFANSGRRVISKSNTGTPADHAWALKFNAASNERLDFRLTTVNGYEENSMPNGSYPTSWLNEWHHVAVTYDESDGGIEYYLDGILIGTDTHSLGGAIDTTSGNPIGIGNQASGAENTNARSMDGFLDDVRVYNRPLSTNEIQSLAAACQEGSMIYNADRHVPQYCAGDDNWIAMGPVRDGITNGLLAHWQLDETSGTTAGDASGSLLNGTMQGGLDASTNSRNGKINTSLNFDGIDDQISLGDIDIAEGDTEVSVCAWVYVDSASISKDHDIFSDLTDPGGGAQGLLLWVDDVALSSGNTDTITFTVNPTLARAEAPSSSFVAREWTHLCGTFLANTYTRLFKNGEMIAEDTSPVSAVQSSASAASYIGRRGGPPGTGFFQGKIDEVRVYNRALSRSEIQALFDLGNNDDSSLVGHWKLDELSGTNAVDSSGNSNTGTLTNYSSPEPWSSSGQVNSSLNFDGSSNYVQIADSTSLDVTSNLTVAAWVKPDTCTPDPGGGANMRSIMGKWQKAGNNRAYILGMSRGTNCNLLFNISDDGGWAGEAANGVVTTDILTVDTWAHVVATYDGSTNLASIYINGTLSASSTATDAASVNIYNSSAPLRIGATQDWGDSPKYFSGHIDDVRVYNRVLSTTEIDALHKMGIGNCTNPIGKEGDLIMGDIDPGVGTNNALMYCDGANWQAVGKTP